VQYFQRAKMEWHPENPISSQVTLGNLGDEYIARYGLPASTQGFSLVSPQPTPPPPVQPVPTPHGSTAAPPATPAIVERPPTVPVPVQGVVGSLRVTASVRYPITGQGGSQTIYVRVVDDVGQPVAGVAVEAVVHFRGGDELHRLPSTDATGSTSLTFSIGYPPPGYTVIIDVRATYGGRTASARTSFIPWW